MVEWMFGRQAFEPVFGQRLGDLTAERQIESHPAATGVGQQQPARLQIAPQHGGVLVRPGKLPVPGHVQQRIPGHPRVFQADVLAFELHFHRRVVADVLQKIMHRRRIGIPIAVVDQLREHQVVATGGGRLVIDLRAAQETPKLERAEDIRNQIRPKLPGLVDDNACAARMIVPVPTARHVARRKDHARATAEIDPFETGRLDKRRSVPFLIGQIAQFVIGRVDRLLGQHLAQGAAGKYQLDFTPERLGEIVPAAAGVADDRPAVEHVPREILPNLVVERELVVPGEQQRRQLAGIVGEVGKIGLDRPIVDPQLLGQPRQQRDHVGRIGHPIAILHPSVVSGDPTRRAERRLAHKRRRSGRALLFAPPQRRGGQRQRGK